MKLKNGIIIKLCKVQMSENGPFEYVYDVFAGRRSAMFNGTRDGLKDALTYAGRF